MKLVDATADEVVNTFLSLDEGRGVSVLDSCGVGNLGSRLLIAGVDPVAAFSISNRSANETLSEFQQLIDQQLPLIFTISYELGRKFEAGIFPNRSSVDEPDVYVAQFDSLVVHNYDESRSYALGNKRGHQWRSKRDEVSASRNWESAQPISNFTKEEYLSAIETIRGYIRNGDVYQANLTQQIRFPLNEGDLPQDVFWRLRRDHPAAFSAYIHHGESVVVSASPERLFRIDGPEISVSPIKGTRPRGVDEKKDRLLRDELIHSEKDRAENTMIVDLVRNDIGRVCEFGSVNVESLCELEEHPTLFHLVSTVKGRLRTGVQFADVLKALFPCGSITGAPKISSMKIIDELEQTPRGLSMGAIGYYIPDKGFDGLRPGFDLSVAIRTMVIRDGTATFNVGGGVTIESDPEAEYAESLLKAKALLNALGNKS
jgi:aminodeoxychorismate synthase component I